MKAPKFVEGVAYWPFVVSFTLTDGRRRRIVRWSPGYPWVGHEIYRELLERFGVGGIKVDSLSIRSRPT